MQFLLSASIIYLSNSHSGKAEKHITLDRFKKKKNDQIIICAKIIILKIYISEIYSCLICNLLCHENFTRFYLRIVWANVMLFPIKHHMTQWRSFHPLPWSFRRNQYINYFVNHSFYLPLLKVDTLIPSDCHSRRWLWNDKQMSDFKLETLTEFASFNCPLCIGKWNVNS